MLYDNQDVLQYLDKEKGKLIHLYGEADAGRTLTVFSMALHALQKERMPAYVIPNSMMVRYKDCPDLCPIIIAKSVRTLVYSVRIMSNAADIIFIDNFLQYILHKPKKDILAVFRTLQTTALETDIIVVLVNDLRYLEAKGGYHPAYQEYFRKFCDSHIQVIKDANCDIGYEFVDRKALY